MAHVSTLQDAMRMVIDEDAASEYIAASAFVDDVNRLSWVWTQSYGKAALKRVTDAAARCRELPPDLVCAIRTLREALTEHEKSEDLIAIEEARAFLYASIDIAIHLVSVL